MCICLLLLVAGNAYAQKNAAVRAEIDELRGSLGYFDKEALEKSKQFIRKDSSYYVGYMFEGSFKYNRSADIHGYENAAKPLQKAMDLLVKDFGRKLKVRSSDIMSYVEAYRYQYDYCIIVGLLEESYRNIERPDLALKVLQDMRSRNMQKEFFGDAFTTISWIYHRSRIHTSEKYPFLGNSIEENNRIALAYLDSAIAKYKKFRSLNLQVFPKEFVDSDLHSVYHYKSLIHAYEMQIDSAEKYYRLLMPTGVFPNNNYATWKLTLGEFGAAEEYYKKAQERDYLDKRIREANYMLSIINIYQSKPKEGIKMLQEMIKAQGSTPGFGWHNIGLARAYYYEGLQEESMLTASKAAQFHELHIGTTWGQEQYDMAVSLLKYMNHERAIQSLKFEDRNWWWDHAVLSSMPAIYVKKYSTQFILVNQFANNPERERVTYKLFSSESITTFDEIWFLIRGFSPDYFISKFKKLVREEKRERVKKYYRYFIAKFLLDKEETELASAIFKEILKDKTLDPENEKLLIARIYEAIALAADENDNDEERDEYLMKLYELYPQLLPHSELEMKFNLDIETPATESETKILEELKECQVDWEGGREWPTVTVGFRTNEKKLREMYYTVRTAKGDVLVPLSSIIISNPSGAGKKLAYRLFNITKP
jgi:hypothetical protein